MSSKIKKMTREDIKVTPVKKTPEQEANELYENIQSMVAQRDEKIDGAREHLSNQLSVMAEKYLTANGLMTALVTTRDVLGTDLELTKQLGIARKAAKSANAISVALSNSVLETDVEKLDDLFDAVFNRNFVNEEHSTQDLVDELLKLNICQQAAPNAHDIAEFKETATEEVEKAIKEYKDFCKENNLEEAEIA